MIWLCCVLLPFPLRSRRLQGAVVDSEDRDTEPPSLFIVGERDTAGEPQTKLQVAIFTRHVSVPGSVPCDSLTRNKSVHAYYQRTGIRIQCWLP